MVGMGNADLILYALLHDNRAQFVGRLFYSEFWSPRSRWAPRWAGGW